jgi:hypothetical protein
MKGNGKITEEKEREERKKMAKEEERRSAEGKSRIEWKEGGGNLKRKDERKREATNEGLTEKRKELEVEEETAGKCAR